MKAIDIFLKALGFAGCLLLTIFAGVLTLMAISIFIVSIIDGDLIAVGASIACAFLSALCWSIRKDTLV